MKKISKIFIILLWVIAVLSIAFAAACSSDKGVTGETLSSGITDITENGKDEDPDGSEGQGEGDQDGQDDNEDNQDSIQGGSDDDAQEEQNGGESSHFKPNATVALMSSLENLINEPENFEVSLNTVGGSSESESADGIRGLIYLDLHTGGSITDISLEETELRAKFGDLSLWLYGGSIYAAYGDIKLKLTLSELYNLAGFAATPAPLSASTDVLNQLLSGEFTVNDGSAQLKSSLIALGATLPVTVDFEVCGRNNYILTGVYAEIVTGEEKIGLRLDKSDAAAPEALSDAQSFAAAGGAIYDLARLFTSQYISATLNYSDESGLELSGEVAVNTATFEVTGNFELGYKDFTRAFGATYKNGNIYLLVDGLKIKASADDILNVIQALLPQNLPEIGDFGAIDGLLQKALGLKLDDYITIHEDGNALLLAVKGAELLRAFGIEADIGDINLSVGDGKVSASVAGVSVTLKKGTRFSADVEDYKDLSPLILKIPEIVEAGAVSFTGGAEIDGGDSAVGVELKKGVISWKNGVRAYFDLTLTAGGGAHDLTLLITESFVQMAYGEVGVKVDFAELPALEQALFAAYNRICDLAVKVAGENNPLPRFEDIDQALAYIKGLAATSAAAGEMAESFKNFDLISLLEKTELGASQNGLARISCGGLSAELFDETDKDSIEKLFGLTVDYVKETLSVSADIHLNIFTDEVPEMPEIEQYLGINEFAEIIDYVVAAINTMSQTDVTLNFNGNLTGKYNEIDAKLSYHSPNGFPITVNYEGKSVRLDNETYLNFDLKLKGAAGTDDLYLAITVIDNNSFKNSETESVIDEVNETENKNADGILDFYVSISRFGTSENAEAASAQYKPLYFHATADEILTLLSGALVAAGVDNSFIDDFFITKWITSFETKAQLEACGNALIPLLGNLLGGNKAGQEESAGETADGADSLSLFTATDLQETRQGLLKKLAYGDNTFEIEVDTGAPEGKFNLTLVKTQSGEGEEVLSLLGNVNFNYGGGKVKGNLNVGYVKVEPKVMTAPEGVKMYDFAGADELLLSLAKSVTHPVGSEIISGEETKHDYVLNNYYYIDGDITVSFGKLIDALLRDKAPISIKLVAISVTVDEDGIPAINLRLMYDGVEVGGVMAINGDSIVDITIKDGMVYMRREQTNYYDSSSVLLWEHGWKDYSTPITFYRAMPLENFMGDILNQLGFILNFGEKINNAIADAGSGETQPDTSTETAVVKDYGTMVGEVLIDYIYGNSESGGASWTLKLNGSSFSNGILGDFTITLGENGSGYIKELNLSGCQIIPVKGLVITAGLELTWHNPGGVMDSEGNDQTVDVGDILADPEYGMGAMIEKLTNEGGWTYQKFIEGKDAAVNYVVDALGGTQSDLGSQNVMVSTGGDGLEANTLFGKLKYPEAPKDEKVYSVWTEYNTGDILPSDFKIHAEQHKQIYTVKFYSSEEIEDWTLEDGRYSKIVEMEYGAQVWFENDNNLLGEIYTVTGNAEISLPARPEGSSRWAASLGKERAVFKVLYNRDTVNYYSDIAFDLNGNISQKHAVQFTDEEYTLETPTAEGYIFVGWFQQTEDGWKKVDSFPKTKDGSLNVTVEALWAKVAGVGLSVNKSSKTYTANATLNEIIFFGAMKEEVTQQSVKYKFNFKGILWTSDKSSEFTSSNSYSVAAGSLESYSNASVEVKAVYKIGEYEFNLTQNSGEVAF